MMSISKRPESGTRLGSLGVRLVQIAHPGAVACVSVMVVIILAALGLAFERSESDTLTRWNLDREGFTYPLLFSALLLFGAAALSVVCGVVSGSPRPWLTLGLVFVFAAFDETFGLHERAERATGIDWQVLYAPVVVLAAGVAIVILRHVRREPVSVVLFFSGGMFWFLALVLEAVQWDANDEKVPLYTSLMVSEEIFEMIGSLLLGLGVLVFIRSRIGMSPALRG